MSYLKKLQDLAEQKLDYNSQMIATHVLGNEKFPIWSGSASPDHHHYGEGGLVRHTYEVVNLCFINKDALNIKTLDDNELFLAALFHDIGKLYDYDVINGVWQKTEHIRLIHHISRSAITWSNIFAKYSTLDKKYHDSVLHAILAHHGFRAWGSPVAPKTQVAWMLHLCDGISARMDDWNKLDFTRI